MRTVLNSGATTGKVSSAAIMRSGGSSLIEVLVQDNNGTEALNANTNHPKRTRCRTRPALVRNWQAEFMAGPFARGVPSKYRQKREASANSCRKLRLLRPKLRPCDSLSA